eukprot:4128430-Amphidinium_carterae.1
MVPMVPSKTRRTRDDEYYRNCCSYHLFPEIGNSLCFDGVNNGLENEQQRQQMRTLSKRDEKKHRLKGWGVNRVKVKPVMDCQLSTMYY